MKGICRPRCKCGLFAATLLAAGLLGAAPKVGSAQVFNRCEPYDPCPPARSTGAAQPGTGAPGGTGEAAATPPAGGTAQNSPAADLFAAQDVGAAGGAASAAPIMIGDFFGADGLLLTLNYGTFSVSRVVPPPGGAIPRFKMAENTSPMPMDRAYFDYDYYHDVRLGEPSFDVNAAAPGFEKTFFDGMMSFEMRLPVAATLGHNVYLDGTTSTGVGEAGDLGMALKCLLINWDAVYLSGGLAMTVPTAGDSQYFAHQGDANPQVIIGNKSMHLMPFLGGLWIPDNGWFGIGYFQLDFDANGDPAEAFRPTDLAPDNFAPIGRYREATMMYVDLAVGYWAFRGEQDRLLSGLAGVLEVHVNQSLNYGSVLAYPASSGTPPPNTVGSQTAISIVDATLGAHAEIGRHTTLTAGYCLPLTSQREFDGEFRLLVNYRF